MRLFKTKWMFSSLQLGIVLGLVSAPVLAITPDVMDQNGYHREFKLLDIDGNGKLSAAEIQKDELFNGGGFSKADKNGNKSLSENEYATYKSAVQQKETKRVAKDLSLIHI